MRTKSKSIFSTLTPARIGMGFAWLGVLIYAASNSISTLLVDIGAANPVADGRNAITFTNLLFLGSLISLVPMALLFRGDWTRENLSRLGRRDWSMLTFSAFLSSALTPGLMFFALDHSNVTNIVLVSRIEPPLFLLAAAFFLKERIDPRAFIAGLIALCGAMMMISLRGIGSLCAFDIGEFAAVAATLSYIASAIVARRALKSIPMGIFSIYRTATGTVIYFLLISALQGPQQFQDLFAPVLLQWIWVYAIIVIVVGQLAWFFALKYARASDMSLATSFSPLAGIVFAMILLGENPGPGFIPGAALILAAVAVAQMKQPLDLRRIWQHVVTHVAAAVTRVPAPMTRMPAASRLAYT